ncbi:MAG: NB-ARC domain-containing protein [Nostoc sp.]|uniref:NB-ARC domain-containing protein n=1 Tax=Nostoc sp. TaxID=1180 RepID=UPI002FF0C111
MNLSRFYGRSTELETLSQWIVGDRARLITLLAMGGIGKTVLAVKVAEHNQDAFEYIFWRQ